MLKKMAHLNDGETPLLPASFLHASLRASNSLFIKRKIVRAAVVVGSRFGNNWSMKRRQVDGTTTGVVTVPVCYPIDAGSNQRTTMLTNMNGTGCHSNGPKEGICIDGTCLYTQANECACNQDVNGEQVGDILSKWLTTKSNLVDKENLIHVGVNKTWAKFLSPYSCWYENTQHGLQETIEASNSIWRERQRWSREDDYRYRGWTECPVTSNIRDHNMIDAILVSLPISPINEPSLCDFDETIQQDVQSMLRELYTHGYQSLPIVFLEQSRGISNQSECDFAWGGTRCDDGYRKEIFSQPFNFSDGSRLIVPDGCKDVYFFPAGVVVSSKACQRMERNSPYHANILARSNVANYARVQVEDEVSEFLLLPSFSVMACINFWQCLAFTGCWNGGNAVEGMYNNIIKFNVDCS